MAMRAARVLRAGHYGLRALANTFSEAEAIHLQTGAHGNGSSLRREAPVT